MYIFRAFQAIKSSSPQMVRKKNFAKKNIIFGYKTERPPEDKKGNMYIFRAFQAVKSSNPLMVVWEIQEDFPLVACLRVSYQCGSLVAWGSIVKFLG